MSTPPTPIARPTFCDEAPTAPDPAHADALRRSSLVLIQELRHLGGSGEEHPAEMGLRRAIALLAIAAAMGDDRGEVQRLSGRVLRWLDRVPDTAQE